jgi:hypothetical protein
MGFVANLAQMATMAMAKNFMSLVAKSPVAAVVMGRVPPPQQGFQLAAKKLNAVTQRSQVATFFTSEMIAHIF